MFIASSGWQRFACVVLLASLLVFPSTVRGSAADFENIEIAYDQSTGVVELCGNLENYHFGHGSGIWRAHQLMVFDVRIGSRDASFAWIITSEDHPCLQFAADPNLSGRVELAYYHSVEILDPRVSFLGTQRVDALSSDLQERVRRIKRGSRQPIRVSHTALYSSVSVYLRLNGKTPGSEANIAAGVSNHPLEFSWFAQGVPPRASIKYRYRLYPTQLDWSNWGATSSAAITYIPAGIHVFQVDSELSLDGKTSSVALAQHQFTIEAPYVGPVSTRGTLSAHLPEVRVYEYPRKRALLLGVTSYKDAAAFHSLPFVTNDVNLLGRELLRHGFAKADIEAEAAQLSSTAVQQRIRAFLARAADDEQTIIYLSGHGFTSGESDEIRALFAGYDCNRNTEENCLSLNSVKEDLQTAVALKHGPRHILLIVDACAAGQAVIAKGFTMELAAAASRSVQVVTAGTRGEDAREDPLSHTSIFTHYLIEGLGGGADIVTDKVITLSELMVWVRWKVALDTGGQQTPSFARIKGTGEMMFDVPKQ